MLVVPYGEFSLERSTARAFAVPLRVLSQNKYDRRYLKINWVLIFSQNWYLLGVEENFKPCPQNRILLPHRGSFQLISDEQPRPFFMGVHPGGIMSAAVWTSWRNDVDLQCLHEGYLQTVRRQSRVGVTIWGPQRRLHISVSTSRNTDWKGRYHQINHSEQTCSCFSQLEPRTKIDSVFPPFESVVSFYFEPWLVNCCLCCDWSDVTSSVLVSR